MKFFWPLQNKNYSVDATSELSQSTNWKETIEAIVKMNPLSPFHQDVLSFLQTLSRTILKDHLYRRFPELIALAYWIRKAHLTEMHNEFIQQKEGKMVVAKGAALHFAPSNVDTIFVYSWVLSMLAGNNNILRISGRKQEQSGLLIEAIITCLEDYPEVAKRTAILTYDHNFETTKFLSERCQIRVIWGGDDTVKSIRTIPLAPLATELVFPNRFSLSMLDAEAVLNANEQESDNLIHCFYNDGFWFAQMACSSPRLIVWIGDSNIIQEASGRFWDKLNEYVSNQMDESSPALQVQKLATGYLFSTKDHIHQFLQKPAFSRLKVTEMDGEIRERHCGGGFFVELELPKLLDLIPFLQDRDQTLSYYGFSRDQLVELASNIRNRSIDRIVPIGQSLDFEGVWDGYDLLLHFTREIVIR